MTPLPADTAARFAVARIDAALVEIARVEIPAEARRRVDYLLRAARDGYATFADRSVPTTSEPSPAQRAVAAADRSGSAVIIPFPRRAR